MLLYTMLYIVLAYLMLFAALTNSVCLNNASFFFLFKYFLCQGYELSGEIALKNNHYYYYYYMVLEAKAFVCLFVYVYLPASRSTAGTLLDNKRKADVLSIFTNNSCSKVKTSPNIEVISTVLLSAPSSYQQSNHSYLHS